MTQDPEVNIEAGREPDFELERRVDRALKQLPSPAAPAWFAARVMSRIDQQEMAVVVPASLEWPLLLKIALTGVSLAMVVGALLMWPLALEFARTSWNSPAVALARGAVNAARDLVPIALVYVTAMCAVSAAAVSMLKHVALGGAQNS